MVDTPGHADFGMEVSKSLDSVEGAVLLFDAAQGVQAQTLSVYDKAKMIGMARQRAGFGLMRGGNGGGGEGEEEGGVISGKDEEGGVKVEEELGEGGEEEGNNNVGGIQILPALTKVDMPSARQVRAKCII